MFISFCGIDGCGKTTQVKRLETYLSKKKLPVKVVHGFKPPKYSKELKEIAKLTNVDFHELYSSDVRTFSFLMDLIRVINESIIPYKDQGTIVIAEKYYLDTLIYAPLLGTDIGLLERFGLCVPSPDKYIYLDIDPHEAEVRTIKRSRETGIELAPKENIEIAKHARIKYLEYIDGHNDLFICVNASMCEDDVHNIIIRQLLNLVGSKK